MIFLLGKAVPPSYEAILTAVCPAAHVRVSRAVFAHVAAALGVDVESTNMVGC